MPLDNFYTWSSFVLHNMVLVLHNVTQSSHWTVQVTPFLGYILSGWRVMITFKMGPTAGKLLVGFLCSQYLQTVCNWFLRWRFIHLHSWLCSIYIHIHSVSLLTGERVFVRQEESATSQLCFTTPTSDLIYEGAASGLLLCFKNREGVLPHTYNLVGDSSTYDCWCFLGLYWSRNSQQ